MWGIGAAALAFVACAVTGYALAELPYQTGDQPEAGSGNIMTHFVGRTTAAHRRHPAH